MAENNSETKLVIKKVCYDYDIDEKKLGRLVNRIILLEKRNLNTNLYTSSEIVDKIIEMIKEEVNKCF